MGQDSEHKARKSWWRSRYDPKGSTTYAFFKRDKDGRDRDWPDGDWPDKDGPYRLFLRDVGNLFLNMRLLFVILYPV